MTRVVSNADNTIISEGVSGENNRKVPEVNIDAGEEEPAVSRLSAALLARRESNP
jgi:hypothetical protein